MKRHLSLRIEIDSMPTEIDELERKRIKMEIEQEALKKEKDKASKERLDKLKKELADLNDQLNGIKGQWQLEKDVIQTIRQIKTEIDEAHMEEQRAERSGDLSKVAEIRYGKIVNLEHELEEENSKTGRDPAGAPDAERRGRCRRYCCRGRQMDRHTGGQAA